jgi:hypothetical protein
MTNSNELIIKCIDDNIDSLKIYESDLESATDKRKSELVLDYPTVYIHYWPESNKYDVYVGEANSVFKRTRQHYSKKNNKKKWQSNLKDNDDAKLYIIGHSLFNKSLTLDVENRLMHYLSSVDKVQRVHNGRANPQRKYYPSNQFDDVFDEIWEKLHCDNPELFPDAKVIKDSAIYKASPFHKLTDKQLEARDQIISSIDKALKKSNASKTKQFIFIEGEAGTGKTVLNTSTFFEVFNKYKNKAGFSFSVVINHEEQEKVYKDIAEKLGITDKFGECVTKASRFLNLHPTDDSVDVVFVDEAHLLFTEGNQGYQGDNQLDDIVKKAKVTVIVFDKNQILRMDQYLEAKVIEHYKGIAEEQNNYIPLKEQLRIVADKETIKWIDDFSINKTINKIPKNDSQGYEIRVFETPQALEDAIKEKASKKETKLSRLIANYDWEYRSNKSPSEISNPKDKVKRLLRYLLYFEPKYKDTWGVLLEEEKWFKPWNYELKKTLTRKEKSKLASQSWAEQEHTIDEVGSTFTIQGFDLNYAGVILGESVKYRNGTINFDPTVTSNGKVDRTRRMLDGSRQSFAEDLLKHELRVLMTRGVNGVYIYAQDKELRDKLLEMSK